MFSPECVNGDANDLLVQDMEQQLVPLAGSLYGNCADTSSMNSLMLQKRLQQLNPRSPQLNQQPEHKWLDIIRSKQMVSQKIISPACKRNFNLTS